MAHSNKTTKGSVKTHDKKTHLIENNNQKKTLFSPHSSDNEYMVWIFKDAVNSGSFSFDASRGDMNHKDLLSKIIVYSKRTWKEIKKETHDDGKSKHHYIGENIDRFSKEARDEVRKYINEEDIELIYSFRLDNLHRVIGIRRGEFFYAKWYDPEHKFYPADP